MRLPPILFIAHTPSLSLSFAVRVTVCPLVLSGDYKMMFALSQSTGLYICDRSSCSDVKASSTQGQPLSVKPLRANLQPQQPKFTATATLAGYIILTHLKIMTWIVLLNLIHLPCESTTGTTTGRKKKKKKQCRAQCVHGRCKLVRMGSFPR